MTSAEQFRAAMTHPASTVSIAGVAWPAYKLVAILLGLLTFIVVGAATLAAGPAVLSGAGVTVLAWLALGAASRQR